MRVLNKYGTKERLFEMMERVNKTNLKENYEVHYSDGIRKMKKFDNPDQGVEFMKSEIKSNPNLRNIELFKAGKGFHSTADESSLMYWWGDGSYYDNRSHKEPELKTKKLEIEESFDSPKPKDKEYLDKTSGDQDSQVSKYDGGVDYPAIDDLKVNDPALKKITDDVNEEDCGCDVVNPEDMLLDPSTHWVDHYAPKNIADENINYPSPFTDLEAGEDEYEEEEEYRRGEMDEPTRDITDTKKGDRVTLNTGEVVMVVDKISPTMYVVVGDDGRERSVNLEKISNISESDSIKEKSDELPDDINIPIADLDVNDERVLGRQVPHVTQGDVNSVINSSKRLGDWKEKFISLHGDKGSLVKNKFFKNSFDVVGNESYEKSREESNANKEAFLDKERKAGKNSMLDNYIPAMNEDSSLDVEIYDELEMRYSPTLKNISYNDISEVAQMYDMDEEDVIQIASQVITDQLSGDENQFNDDVKDLIKRFQNHPEIEMHKISPNVAWEVFQEEYDSGVSGDVSFEKFKKLWDNLTTDPNQLKMFNEKENVETDKVIFNCDNKGNFIPVGHEEKNIALRSIEKPMGSGNWVINVITIDENGNIDEILEEKNTWEEAKESMLNYL